MTDKISCYFCQKKFDEKLRPKLIFCQKSPGEGRICIHELCCDKCFPRKREFVCINCTLYGDSKEKTFYEKLRSVYLNRKESSVDRCQQVYNLVILEWQNELTREDVLRRSEPPKEMLNSDGTLKTEGVETSLPISSIKRKRTE